MVTSVPAEKGPPKGLTPGQWRGRLTDAVLSSFFLQSQDEELPERILTKKVFDAFCRLREKKKYEYWLGGLHFEKGKDTNISKGLEDVLFALGAFGLVTVENHDFRYLRADRESKREIKDQIESRLPDEQLKKLRELSDEFAAIVK